MWDEQQYLEAIINVKYQNTGKKSSEWNDTKCEYQLKSGNISTTKRVKSEKGELADNDVSISVIKMY